MGDHEHTAHCFERPARQRKGQNHNRADAGPPPLPHHAHEHDYVPMEMSRRLNCTGIAFPHSGVQLSVNIYRTVPPDAGRSALTGAFPEWLTGTQAHMNGAPSFG